MLQPGLLIFIKRWHLQFSELFGKTMLDPGVASDSCSKKLEKLKKLEFKFQGKCNVPARLADFL